MFPLYTRLTALIISSLCLLVSCSPGPNIFDLFTQAPHKIRTNNCNDSLSGDWKIKTVYDDSGKQEKLEQDSYFTRIQLRFNVNIGCDVSSLTFAFASKNNSIRTDQTTASAQYKAKLLFPDYHTETYFSFKLRGENSHEDKFMIVKYKLIDDDTLEVSLVNKEFLVKAIKNKIIQGSISRRYKDPEITASSKHIDTFIQQHSKSLFRMKMTYVRIQQTHWDFKNINKTL